MFSAWRKAFLCAIVHVILLLVSSTVRCHIWTASAGRTHSTVFYPGVYIDSQFLRCCL